MKLVEITPLTHSIQKDSLTYFSSKPVSVGDVVTIEVRKGKYDALVLDVNEVKNLKQDIKSASFGMKKILGIKGPSILYPEFFEACIQTKYFFIGNLGPIVNFFLPTKFLENYENISKPKKFSKNKEISTFSGIQKPFSERIKFYKKHFKEVLLNKRSIMVVLPTINQSKKFYEEIKTEFPNIFIFHSQEKNLIEKYNSLIEEPTPCIIITTPSGMFIPRHDLGSIILEKESSSSYRTIKKPYFDIRTFSLFLARSLNVDLIFADDFLSVETISRVEERKNLKFDLPDNFPSVSIIDMTDKENSYKKSFVLSKQVSEILNKKERTLLFTLRKGLATQVVCHDCKHILKDGDIPLTLFENQKTGERTLKNNLTNIVLEGLRCPNCNSWNFDNLGIGSDTISVEIKKHFPKKEILQIDKELVKTKKKAKEIISKFYENENVVLVGTEMVIDYLKDPIENIVIVSMDTLLHIPSYKIYEKMFGLISNLATIAKNNLLIQTRTIDNPVVDSFVKKDLKSFFKADLSRRKTFSYPPFGTIIKITHSATKDESAKVNNFINENLVSYSPSIRRSKKGKFFQTNIVIKLPIESWNEGTFNKNLIVNKSLFKMLSSLTPDWQIRVNPENLF